MCMTVSVCVISVLYTLLLLSILKFPEHKNLLFIYLFLTDKKKNGFSLNNYINNSNNNKK